MATRHRHAIRSRLALSVSISSLALAATILPVASSAQLAQSTLRGRAPAGTEVVATEVNTGSTRRATANADGTYVIAGIQPGNYHVTAGAQSADVVVTVASTSVVDLETQETAQASDIVVTGTRPTADNRSAEVNQFVTLHDIGALPQTTRNFLEFADTIPGVQFQVDNNGNTSLRGGAQLASAVNVYIDGISQKDFVGGGSGITGSSGPNGNGDPGNPFPQLAIAEYKVVTSNYTAQYGDASSAVIIAQTKSGTNQFHGEAFGEYTDQHLRARTPAEIAAGTPKGRAPSKQYGVALGGPIIKDVAHFFFTWEHKSLSNQNSVYSGANGISQAQASALLPAGVASQFGSITNPFTENLYFGKIDLEPTDKDRIEATAKYRIEDSFVGGGGQAAASTRAPFQNNDRRADIRWQHSEDWLVNEIKLSYQNTRSSTTTTNAAPQNQYIYYPNANIPTSAGTILITGGPGSGVGRITSQRGYTLQDDLTLPNISLAGDHILHIGASYGAITLTSQDASADVANATYYYAVTPAGTSATPFEVQYPLLSADVASSRVVTKDKQYAAYVQDDWTVDRHLTINLGVRFDREVVPAYLNYVTPAYVVAGLNTNFPGTNQTYASVLAQGNGPTPGFNVFDYVSTGRNRKAPNNFSPRIGFSYDPYGNGRHVIFGGYARAYTRNLFSTLALETLKIALNGNPQVYFPSAQTTDAFGPCRTAADINPANHCYAFDPKYLTPAGLQTIQIAPNSHEIDLLHNDIRTPHSDQFSLGMRNRVGDWNTQVTLSYIESFDGIVGRFGNRYANGAYFQNGIQWGAQGIPGAGTLIAFDNGAKDRLLQLGIGAQRPYTKASGWSATLSYTLSFADQNNLAGGSNPYAINNNQYLFDLPYYYQYPFVRGTAVPQHRFVGTYSRDLFWGISAAAKVELASPNYATAIFDCGDVCNSQGGRAQFVSKRPAGFLGYRNIDVQLSKDFTFFGGAGGYIRADVLNVFNFKNYDPGAVYYPNGSAEDTPVYNRQGNIVGLPLTLKVSGGLHF